jgi:hypothetical protein
MEGGTSISATNTSEKRKQQLPPHIPSQGEEDSSLGPRQIKYPRLVHPVASTTSTTDYNCNNVLVVTRSRRPFEIESPPNKRWDDKPFRGQEVKAASTATASATTQTNCAASASTSTSISGGVGTFQCASCGCKFVRDYQLWWHWRDHIPRRDRHLCHLCPFVSNEANSLKQHVHRCHETPLGGVACNVCQGAFVAKDRDDLSRHIFRSHMFDKRFFLKPITRIKSVPLLPTTQSASLRLMMSSTASLTTPTRSAIF